MKKIRYTITAFLLVLILLPGCEDFLNTELQGNLTQETFPTTAGDALLANNAVYASLREWNYNSGGYPILDIMSDDARKGSNTNDQVANLGPYNNFTITTTQDGLDRWWTNLYQGIKRANVVINIVSTIDMDTTLRNRYVAEARFLRGLFYFDLVRAWGEVPVITSENPPVHVPKSPVDDVYSLIRSDLNYAVTHLPLRSEYQGNDIGRATKGAAKSLLAKVYLFDHDFVNAGKYALEVINSDEYGLEPVFTDANGVNGEHGTESVFEVGALEVSGGGGPGNQYANTQGVRGTPNRGWGFNRPSLDLRNSFESGDPRLKGTIIDLGDTIDGIKILGDGPTPDELRDSQGNLIEVECYSRKVWMPGTSTIEEWGYNRRIIRYADVLLMAAEALNENDKPGQALIYLNKVRERARQGNTQILPDITETNKDSLRDIILEERRHELAMEGQRFWDLVRTGKAQDVLGPLGYTSKYETLPIPQNEIDISQGSLVQNPNWQ
ncbi:MAG TPA: RagB/SusD family nutrient uptake outer membrane protein [Bacteroidales bacterium]|nr:RagB/SusD family nutrient uptake outer membrane protein [Bacteroidales bacterium]